MTSTEFLNEVVRVYLSGNYTVSESIEITKKMLNVTDKEFVDWFGR